MHLYRFDVDIRAVNHRIANHTDVVLFSAVMHSVLYQGHRVVRVGMVEAPCTAGAQN